MLNASHGPVQAMFEQALALHQQGRLAEAEPFYRKILAREPNHADAWHLLGVLACQAGNHEWALELIGRAIQLNPRHPAYYSNLGETLRKAGRREEAEQSFRKAIATEPRFADAYMNYGSLLLEQERLGEAREVLQRAVAAAPESAWAWRLMGDLCAKEIQAEQSAAAYRRALAIQPALHDARYNLALALNAMGKTAEAEAEVRQVLAALPSDPDARLLLAEILARQSKYEAAIDEYRRSIESAPASTPAQAGLANALRSANRLDEAIDAYAGALQLTPNDAVVMSNQAISMRDRGQVEEAVDLLREAVRLAPDNAAVHSGLVFTLHLDPRASPESIEAEQARWNQRHSEAVASLRRPHTNDRTADRRLRVGYVSADFRSHPVGRFMWPLLRSHNRKEVEVFCYSAVTHADLFTDTLRLASDHWREIAALTDDQAAQLIREDAIDILVDLNNHTVGNRLLLFARKPAPVQISYLAYCAPTGLGVMDWRLTDPWIDPPDEPDHENAEQPLRLPETYWCFAPPSSAGEVTPLPAEKNGCITFGCLNHASKINRQVLELWADLLTQLPRSRLLLHAPAGSRQTSLREYFFSRQIEPGRIELMPQSPLNVYFEQYGRIDMALDPFPWAGGTTTCDALWMGVPVLTLAGAPTVSRGGKSILSNLGLFDWIASSPDDFMMKAAKHSSDIAALARSRTTLRERMGASPLMDHRRFALGVEATFRRAWCHWLNGGSTAD